MPPWADWGGHELDGVRKECEGTGKKELFWGNASFVDPAGNASADTVQGAGSVAKPGDTGERGMVHCQFLEPCIAIT